MGRHFLGVAVNCAPAYERPPAKGLGTPHRVKLYYTSVKTA